MKMMKVCISGLVFLLASAAATPASAGWGSMELAYNYEANPDPVEPSSQTTLATVTIRKVPKTGHVLVTASGEALFDDPSTTLNLTLDDSNGTRMPKTYSVSPGPGDGVSLNGQSWCVRMIYPVTKNRAYTFYLYGDYVNGSLPPSEDSSITVDDILMTAVFFKSNKVKNSE